MAQTAIKSHAGSVPKRPLLVAINKRALNRLVLKLAGRQWSPWAIVQHVGRRSGRLYATPVLATRTTNGLVIPLPFGADTDWCQNVLAASRFTLRWHGGDYALEQPEVREAHSVLRLLGLKHYLMGGTAETHVRRESALAQLGPGVARVGRFVRHLVEMVLAMMLGMALFGGIRALANPTGFADVFREHLDVRYLAMAAFMAVPMIALMRYRGHSWARTTEMMLSMVVPVAAACLLWRFGAGEVVSALSDKELGTSSHVVMYVGMLLAMLYRFGDYAHVGSHTRSSAVPGGENRAHA